MPTQAPEQVDARKPADYLEVITKAVFQSGMSWRVVEAKWDGFREAFHGFDPQWVSSLTPDDVERLAQDTRIIRNRRKIQATIDNADAIVALGDRPGGFRAWLRSHGGFEETIDALRDHFKFLGDMGAYYLLYVVKEPVPAHEESMSRLGARRR
jgi:3-methyladenine DNA glycosylase Tag